MHNRSWLFVQPRKGQSHGNNLSGTNLCPFGQLLHDGFAACRSETWHYGLAHRARAQKRPTTPVSLGERDGQRWLIAAFGEVDWVRNLRAAGEAILQRGQRPEHIFVKELNLQEAAPILKESLAGAPGFLLKNFEATPASSLEAFEREAQHHPVFLIHSAAVRQNTTGGENTTRRRSTV